jgi:hypothetical protein
MTDTIKQFGHGIICPFQRDGKGDFANAGGTRLLSSDIGELLGIIGPSSTKPGELPWRTEVGSRLNTLKHRRLHSELVRATAEQMTSGPVRQFEDRVRTGPTTVETRDDNTMIIRYAFTPVGYRQEAITIDAATLEE